MFRDLQAMVGNIGVRCFCDAAYGIPMWSHYADQHRGICIEFDRARDNTGLTLMALPVTYSDQFPIVEYFSNAKSKLRADDMMRALTQKAKCWEYEREHRILVPEGAHWTLAVSHNAITSVFLGACASAKTEEFVESVNAERAKRNVDRFEIKKMQMAVDGYKLGAISFRNITES